MYFCIGFHFRNKSHKLVEFSDSDPVLAPRLPRGSRRTRKEEVPLNRKRPPAGAALGEGGHLPKPVGGWKDGTETWARNGRRHKGAPRHSDGEWLPKIYFASIKKKIIKNIQKFLFFAFFNIYINHIYMGVGWQGKCSKY